jgi:ribosomal protein S21
MAHHHENNDSPEDAMNDFKPFVLIERTISEIRQAHWPFKGSWKKSRKRGIKVAKRQRWVQKARQLLPMKP